jgi:hypothetical protein
MTGQSNSTGNGVTGCSFETALVNSRRRIPYSVGSDTLAVVPPGSYHTRLDDNDERCLSVDILDLYHVFPIFLMELTGSNFYLLKIPKNEDGFSLINLKKSYVGSFLIHIQRFMYLDLLRIDWEPIVQMVCLPVMILIIVDVCVVTTTKDMDDTCMLASILHDSISSL